jgi:hypothetical protein
MVSAELRAALHTCVLLIAFCVRYGSMIGWEFSRKGAKTAKMIALCGRDLFFDRPRKIAEESIETEID